jgi:HlyD family type I secretion membrane fusion protein
MLLIWKVKEKRQMESNYSKTRIFSILGSIMILIFIIIIGLTIFLLNTPSGAVVSGQFVHKGKPIKVLASEEGVINQVNIQDGKKIKKNQLLVSINDKTEQNRIQNLRQQKFALDARIFRINFELNNSPIPKKVNKEVSKYLQEERKLLKERKNEYDKTLSIYNERINKAETLLDKIKSSNMILAEEQLSLIEENYNMVTKLKKKGIATRTKEIETLHNIVESKNRIAQLNIEIESLNSEIKENNLQIERFKTKYKEELQTEKIQILKRIDEITGQISILEEIINNKKIKSPIDGIIIVNSYPRLDSWVGKNTELFQIIPTNAPLILEGKLRPEDFDNIQIGNQAKVMPNGITGRNITPIVGDVVAISADTITENKTNSIPFYKVKLKVDKDEFFEKYDNKLKSGMPAQAIIINQERKLADFIIEPILNSFRKSFVE